MRKETVKTIVNNHNNCNPYNSNTKLICLSPFLKNKKWTVTPKIWSVICVNKKRIKISLLNTYHKCTQILLWRWKGKQSSKLGRWLLFKNKRLQIITGRFILDRPLQPSGKGKRAGYLAFYDRVTVPLRTSLRKKCTALHSVLTDPKWKQMHLATVCKYS